MKKKWIIIIIAMVTAAIAFAALWKINSSYSSVLEANWGFPLPFKAIYTEEYEKDSGGSFHGDGIRYHVFSYKHDEHVDSMLSWSPSENETLYHGSYSAAATAWLNEIAVPDEHYPNFSECAYWYQAQEDNSELIVFWDNQKNKLYILESFL